MEREKKECEIISQYKCTMILRPMMQLIGGLPNKRCCCSWRVLTWCRWWMWAAKAGWTNWAVNAEQHKVIKRNERRRRTKNRPFEGNIEEDGSSSSDIEIEFLSFFFSSFIIMWVDNWVKVNVISMEFNRLFFCVKKWVWRGRVFFFVHFYPFFSFSS